MCLLVLLGKLYYSTIVCGGMAAEYEYNLLISYSIEFGRAGFGMARKELIDFLSSLGDKEAVIEKTLARGIIGVKTSLDARKVSQEARKKYTEDSSVFKSVIKFVPIDTWTDSTLEAMKKEVDKLNVTKEDKWRMTLEKRRYEKYHTDEIIEVLQKPSADRKRALAPLVQKYGNRILNPLEAIETITNSVGNNDSESVRQNSFLQRMSPNVFNVYVAQKCNLSCTYCY